MDPNSLVLLIGAPRSGTTWLQGILSGHPSVVSPQETDLFFRFIEPLAQAWDWQTRGTPEDWHQRRFKGLPAVLHEAEFSTIVAEFIASVTNTVLDMKASASIVLEKSPAHSLATKTVIRFAPETAFVHLIRDGRDVVASLNAAGRGWGAHWAPTNIANAAEMWATHVREARDAMGAPGGYTELRYEDLRAGGSAEIVRVFRAIGVDVSNEDANARLEMHAAGAATAGQRDPEIRIGGKFAQFATVDEPKGFAGKATSGSWKLWTPRDRCVFDEVAGDLLVELGYEPDRTWAAVTKTHRVKSTTRFIASRGLRSAAARIGRIASRIEANSSETP